MKKLDKPVWPQLFCGSIALWSMDIVLLVAYILKDGEMYDSVNEILAVATVIGMIVSFVVDNKINPKPYDKNDNYDKYFYLLLATAAIVLFCFVVSFFMEKGILLSGEFRWC